MHTTGGYLVYAAMTQYVFDWPRRRNLKLPMWAGLSHIPVDGPLANGAKTILFEGVPNTRTQAA